MLLRLRIILNTNGVITLTSNSVFVHRKQKQNDLASESNIPEDWKCFRYIDTAGLIWVVTYKNTTNLVLREQKHS